MTTRTTKRLYTLTHLTVEQALREQALAADPRPKRLRVNGKELQYVPNKNMYQLVSQGDEFDSDQKLPTKLNGYRECWVCAADIDKTEREVKPGNYTYRLFRAEVTDWNGLLTVTAYGQGVINDLYLFIANILKGLHNP